MINVLYNTSYVIQNVCLTALGAHETIRLCKTNLTSKIDANSFKKSTSESSQRPLASVVQGVGYNCNA